jgi:superfamily II DNA or RNA helicase
MAITLRKWQEIALREWVDQGQHGIVSVVTGGGKTVFALACIAKARPETSLVVVPTVALLDQWWEEAAAFFNLKLDEVHIVKGRKGLRSGTINIAVLNTAAGLADHPRTKECMLVVDECHKAASLKFRRALEIPKTASLGLSATPERQYDDGLQDVLVPALGPVIYEYSYADALRDEVIVPFNLRNVVFDLEDDRQAEYDKLTKSIARCISNEGAESEKAIALMLKRARVLNLSLNRVKIALKIIAKHAGSQTIVFHEDIDACETIYEVLHEHGIPAGVYHSRMPLRQRVETLQRYRRAQIRVLVTCRALDEGFNVPETAVGIIAASTATRRQRIQRLGRVLRPAGGKDSAIIYSLVASGPEISRLKAEEEAMEGVADVTWGRA